MKGSDVRGQARHFEVNIIVVLVFMGAIREEGVIGKTQCVDVGLHLERDGREDWRACCEVMLDGGIAFQTGGGGYQRRRGTSKRSDVGCGDEIGRAIFLEEGRRRHAKPLIICTAVVVWGSLEGRDDASLLNVEIKDVVHEGAA